MSGKGRMEEGRDEGTEGWRDGGTEGLTRGSEGGYGRRHEGKQAGAGVENKEGGMWRSRNRGSERGI